MTNFEFKTTPDTLSSLASFTRATGRCVGGFLLACLPLSMLAPSISASESEAYFAGAMAGELASSGNPIGSDLWGDDTIGVLPVVGGGGSFSGGTLSGLDMIMLFTKPSLVLEGSFADLKRMIADADGGFASFVFLEPTGPDEGRLIFQGAATIELDRQLFATNRVKVSMLTGLTHERNRVNLFLNRKQVSTFTMQGGVAKPFDLNAVIARGLLNRGPLEATIQHNPRLAPDRLAFEADSQRITLRQFQ